MKTRNDFLILVLTTLAFFSYAGCSDEDPASPDDPVADTTAPGAVTDLRVASVVDNVVTLAWTAPGDDGNVGTASEYDLRYSSGPITAGSWEACTQVAAEPNPSAAGMEQNAALDMGGGGNFHFALKTADEIPNWSGLSNEVTALVGGGAFVVNQLTNDGSNIHPCLDSGHVVWVRTASGGGREIYIANLESAFPVLTPVTGNGGEKEHPNNHGAERIVWAGRSTSLDDWEIWLYDEYAIPRYAEFTDNEVHDRSPDLSSAGSFAWLQGPPTYEEVHYWYESGHSESVISSVCCPVGTWSNEAPSADDGAVVWRSYNWITGTDFTAHLWDGSLTDLTDTIEARLTSNYSLYAGTLAYQYGTGTPMIRYWNGSTFTDVAAGYNPSLYAGTVAFEVWDGHDWEIRYWDGTTVHEITDNDYNDTDASLSGTKIAWTGRPSGSSDQIFWVSVAK